ncbi:glycosyltransferase family 2 protein [Flavobacterium sp.]|uniref:glycosyltransferase family 2 protein n=1 Tax=Flavobacterium sp. TaxID=239 RepID=UPI0026025E67|nr:glycosyltransferase family 2 protein [Flavobacterium sp.]MDD3003877.1 glycosyltransferase family 2 protein [Flavobacterium sp.]
MDFRPNKNISVLIITLNEEVHMNELLSDLDFADEVIVVDSYSTDRTKSICESFKNVKFLENKFENYTTQRNFAIDQARNNWILFIDADERLTPALKQEIIETVEKNEDVSAYLFYRTFYFKKKILRFSGWQTDRIYRLFKKDKCRYTHRRLVHEKLDVDGKIAYFKNKLIHYSYADYESYKGKMIAYGKLKAREKYQIGFKPTFFHKYGHSIYNFLYQYLIRLGILDGRKGIIICYLNALSVSSRYKELARLYNEQK